MKLINGKQISLEKRAEIRSTVEKIKQQTNKTPGLATILIGNNPASQAYINSKIKACKEAGIKSFHHDLREDTPTESIISLIKSLNSNQDIDGILLQLPLPNNQNTQACINEIDPSKDVDGLHPLNAGLLNIAKDWDEIIKNNLLVSCTPLGIIYILQMSNVNIEGKNAIVIGRSNLVGKPLSMLLLANNATVTMAHSKTKNLKELCKNADIIVAAIGKQKFLNKNFIKDKSVVIDVGINKTSNGLCGDVDFDSVKDMDIEITPVPGGVGPMTITMLLDNTLKAFISRNGITVY